MANVNIRASISNVDLWNEIRNRFPQFESHTSEATRNLFTESGFEALKAGDYPDVLNDFFNLSLRVYLQMVTLSRAKDILDEGDFGEYYDNPMGGYIQRMSINSIKPVSPAFKKLANGKSVDPFVVNKPEANERLFRQNFDYQSLLTMPDDFQFKQIFISPYGMSEYMGGLMTALENGYTVQKCENKLEAINAGINSTQFPLQKTQIVTVNMSADTTNDELVNTILTMNNVISAMTIGPQCSAFNALKFSTIQDKSRLRILVKPGFKNVIKTKLLANAFNRDELTLDAAIVEVPHFGGLKPYKEAEHTTQLYPVYNTLGTCIGFNEVANQDVVTVEESNVYWKDPNEDVIAIIADKGWMFHSQQNPYTVEPVRNARGLYTNYWASSPNNTIAIDPIYNVVVIKNSVAAV